MRIEPQEIPDVLMITPPRFADSRGFFSETWSETKLKAQGFDHHFVQDNHSRSTEIGTIRGLHCQIAPNPQGKLVRAVRGAIWDVAVDVRQGSATYGKFVAAILSVDNWQQLWIPPGFLHGFCTLMANTEVIYKVTGEYDRGTERGVIWNDSALNLPWPVTADAAILSDKDKILPTLAQAGVLFS